MTDPVQPDPGFAGAAAEPSGSTGDGGRTGERVTADLQAALAKHLLEGRVPADIGQTGVAAVAVWIFWGVMDHTMAVVWFGLFLMGVALRMGFRKARITPATDAAEVLSIVRRDVWLSATLWGAWAFLAMGSPLLQLALLLVVFAGLVAAATSTLVADAQSFFGFELLLLGPLAATVLLGGTDPQHLMLVALILLFAPFMVVAYRRAFGLLRDQIRLSARLRVSEEEAARSRDFVTSLVSSAPTPIVVLDEEGRVLQANPAFHHVSRRDEEDVVGAPLVDLVAVDVRTRETILSYLDTVRDGARSVAELPLQRRDGSEIWIRVSGTRARGTAAGTVVLVAEDVTDQVAAREALEMARAQAEEAARAKSSFLASMSHEIRTPMNGILGMIELLLDSPLTESQREAAEVIRSSGQGLLRILNDILDVSKIEAGQLDLEEIDFDLPQVVLETARMLSAKAGEQGNELLVDVDPSVPRSLRGDPTRLRQVLTNLLGNAVKFTSEGEVVVSARGEPGDGDGYRVRFCVRDTGVGIPLEKQDLIFHEFEQADNSTTRTHGGTGLGLTISKRLVALMGGELALESEEGQGSTFSFTLEFPVSEGDGQAGARRIRQGEDLRGLRFIVVDDNATARRIVQEALRSVGVGKVDEAAGVDRGLAAVRDAAASGEPYHAVVLDHMMPGRDGFDFAREIQSDPTVGDTPLLMVTSTGLGSAKAQARELGVQGFLSKPLARADLVRALAAVVHHREHGAVERRLVTEETIARVTEGTRVLLAEDNSVNQQVAIALLKRRGYHVDAVPDGAQAVEAVEKGEYDIVLMDIQMPVMDGLEATRRIRALPKGGTLPVVALTAHAFAEERERCAAAGMNDFLAKPFKPDDLYELVERWTQGAASTENVSAGDETMDQQQSGAPPVDVEAFRATMREAGIEEIVDATLEIYQGEAPGIFEALEAAVQAGDAEGIRAQAHSLKSSSGNIRATRFAELLQEMEGLGRAEDVGGAQAFFKTVADEYRAVMEYLAG